MAPHSTPGMTRLDTSPRRSTAFIVEVMVLLFFLVGSLAIFTQLFASAMVTSNEAAKLSQATTIAQNAAEEFSADPVAIAKGKKVGAGIAVNGSDGFDVFCKVSTRKTEAGALYKAHITVSQDQTKIYQLNAQRYVEGGAQ